MGENEIGKVVIDCAAKLQQSLGPGLPRPENQLLTCLKLTGLKLGYLLNFNAELMRRN